MAARTGSRASRTALSASPTTVNAGSPSRMSASTQTRRASTPSTAKVMTRESISRALRRARAARGRQRPLPWARAARGRQRPRGPPGRRQAHAARPARHERAAEDRRRAPGGRRTSHRGASERRLKVIEPDEVAGAIDEDGYAVEAQAGAVRAGGGLDEPGDGHPAHLGALAGVQVGERLPGAGQAGLDLGEHERLAVEGHEVELAEPGAVVTGEHLEAEALEVVRGELLAAAAPGVARVGHRGPTLWRLAERISARVLRMCAEFVTNLRAAEVPSGRRGRLGARW